LRGDDCQAFVLDVADGLFGDLSSNNCNEEKDEQADYAARPASLQEKNQVFPDS
jgi:hypothetical protein